MSPVQIETGFVRTGQLLELHCQSFPKITNEKAMTCVGGWLAVEISKANVADFDQVWLVLTHLPDGYLCLLESPEGCVALSAIVAAELGLPSVLTVPAIH